MKSKTATFGKWIADTMDEGMSYLPVISRIDDGGPSDGIFVVIGLVGFDDILIARWLGTGEEVSDEILRNEKLASREPSVVARTLLGAAMLQNLPDLGDLMQAFGFLVKEGAIV